MNPPSASAKIAAPVSRGGLWLLLVAAAGVPVSLLWDFSWESTIGIDLFWSPPHALTYIAMALAGVASVALGSMTKRGEIATHGWIGLGSLRAPLGSWLVMWSALALATAVLFDRWWQAAYGLGAGIWHPPQILKAIAFFSATTGAWLLALAAQNELEDADRTASAMCSVAGGLMLVLISIVTLTSSYPNHQHSASFYKVACATYPIVLAALARSGRRRWTATAGSAVYFLIVGAMVWLLPLFPAKPQVGPIYNPLDHLMPPPFPLLLIVPALAMDWLLKKTFWPTSRGVSWLQAGALGFTFFFCFLCVQWAFAEVLLTKTADNWFFAGGGKHWPFFLKISPPARINFWERAPDQMNWSNALTALGFSIIAARLGLWLGAWMARVRR